MIAKDVSYLVGGRVVFVLLSIVSIKVLTTVLSQEEVGNFYLINAFVMWFSMVLINPVGMYYNRHVHLWHKDALLRSSFKALNVYFFLATCFSFAVLVAIRNLTNVAVGIPTFSFILIISLYTFCSSWFQTLCPTLNLFKKRREFVFLMALSQIIGIAISIILVMKVSASAFNWLLGIVVGQVVTSALAWRFFARSLFKEEKPANFRDYFSSDMLKFSLPVAASTLFMWAQFQGYRLIIEAKAGIEVLAYLGVAFGLATSASGVIETITTQVLHPNFFLEITDTLVESRIRAWEKMWKRAVVVYIPSMLLVAGGAKPLVMLLTAARYHEAAYLVKWGCLIELFRMMSGLLYLVSHSERNTKKSILPYSVGAFITVFGVWVLSREAGGALRYGAPLLAFSSLITFLLTYYSMRSLMTFSLDFRFIFRIVMLSLPLFIFILQPFVLGLYATLLVLFLLGLYALLIVGHCLRKLA